MLIKRTHTGTVHAYWHIVQTDMFLIFKKLKKIFYDKKDFFSIKHIVYTSIFSYLYTPIEHLSVKILFRKINE